jgi:hypothetical protein
MTSTRPFARPHGGGPVDESALPFGVDGADMRWGSASTWSTCRRTIARTRSALVPDGGVVALPDGGADPAIGHRVQPAFGEQPFGRGEEAQSGRVDRLRPAAHVTDRSPARHLASRGSPPAHGEATASPESSDRLDLARRHAPQTPRAPRPAPPASRGTATGFGRVVVVWVVGRVRSSGRHIRSVPALMAARMRG